MKSSKQILTAVFAGLALFVMPMAGALAQDLPSRPPAATVRPKTTITAPVTPRKPSTASIPELGNASVAVKCHNGDSYKLATGSNQGACKLYVENGGVKGGFCTDGENSALQTCATGCKQTMGSGICEKQDPSVSNQTGANRGR